MIFFTAYANKKFEVLASHEVVVSREEITGVVGLADSVDDAKKPLIFARKKIADGRAFCVVYKREGDVQKVITFYPI